MMELAGIDFKYSYYSRAQRHEGNTFKMNRQESSAKK